MISIVIQAGGRSSRMGQDKGLVPLAGKPMVEHVLERVRGLGDEILLTTNSPDSYAYLNLRMASDEEPGAGALPGMLTALRAAAYPHVLIVACDMPFLNRSLLQYQLGLAEQADVVVPFWEENYQTMHAVYGRVRCLEAVERALARGRRRLISFYDDLHVLTIPPDTIRQYDPRGRTFFNANTPEELTEAEQLYQEIKTPMNYRRTVEQLEQNAALSWPIDLADQDDGAAVITELLRTQDEFISILNFPVRSVEEFITILPSARMRPNLFVKHLAVLSDFSGERIKRSITHLRKYIPMGELQYDWDGQVRTFQFRALLNVNAGNIKKKLGIEGNTLFQEYTLNDPIKEMIVLLLVGASALDEDTANWFAKCEISNYLGNKTKLEQYVKQRYIWVSTISKGSTANALGHAAQNYVKDFIEESLDLSDVTIHKDGHLPGVTHYDPESGKETNFDIVVARNGKFVGIEVSFQVTTNSVIQRKSREANASYVQVRNAGHKMAYVIDGAGNFERHQAIRLICENSDCTVAFTQLELTVLTRFIREFLE